VLTAYFSLVDTTMIHHSVDQDDVVTELFGTLPKPLVTRVTPASAAIAIANGLQERSPRVIHPARWRPLSGLRGLIGPALDAHFASNRRTLDILARLDARAHSRADSNGT
jgi:hypothetical protein